jgi:hypothetical protein
MTTAHRFMFATGIENSYPTIKSGSIRVDELETGGHYKHWETDFALLQDLDISYLRYGPPIHRTWLAHDRYDWDFADQTFGRLKALNIVPIVDLCHFGVPNWIGNFQNPDFPQLFAEYARAFAERFPWVQLYTPCQRDVHLRHLLGGLWLVERATRERPGLRDGAQAHRKSECAGNVGHPRRSPGRHLHPE